MRPSSSDRPSSSNHSAAQIARNVHQDRGATQRPSDPPKWSRRRALGGARERMGGGERTSHPASPVGDGEPVRGFPVTDSRRVSPTRDYGPPHGHVIGHRIGGSPPRPRDPNRPAGRIGPYADVVVRHDVRPLFVHVGVRHDLDHCSLNRSCPQTGLGRTSSHALRRRSRSRRRRVAQVRRVALRAGSM